jgi:hypothetical protein
MKWSLFDRERDRGEVLHIKLLEAGARRENILRAAMEQTFIQSHRRCFALFGTREAPQYDQFVVVDKTLLAVSTEGPVAQLNKGSSNFRFD